MTHPDFVTCVNAFSQLYTPVFVIFIAYMILVTSHPRRQPWGGATAEQMEERNRYH